MDYQLVLQFRGAALEDYDEMIALEDELIEAVGDSADVDGHDVGSGERNIFILKSDPVGSFSRVTPVLERTQTLSVVTAAYRKIDVERYTVIWPEVPNRKFKIA